MDTLAVELIIDDQKATVKLDNFGQKIRLVSDDINKIGGDRQFAGRMTQDLDALSKRADATYLYIQKYRFSQARLRQYRRVHQRDSRRPNQKPAIKPGYN